MNRLPPKADKVINKANVVKVDVQQGTNHCKILPGDERNLLQEYAQNIASRVGIYLEGNGNKIQM